MANMIPSPRQAGSRGQLFLIGAIALAVAFVALTMLLNTAIYTENLSARSGDVGDTDMHKYASEAEAQTIRTIEQVNYYNTSPDEFETLIEEEWGPLLAERYATSGSLVDIRVDSVDKSGRSAARMNVEEFEDGKRFAHSSGKFHDFQVHVHPASYVGSGDLRLSSNKSGGDTLIVEQGDDNNELVVSSEDTNGECRARNVDGKRAVTIDIVREEVGGVSCDVLENFEFSGFIDFENNADVEGTWQVTTESVPSSIDSTYKNNAVLTTDIEISYSNSQTEYGETITVPVGGDA